MILLNINIVRSENSLIISLCCSLLMCTCTVMFYSVAIQLMFLHILSGSLHCQLYSQQPLKMLQQLSHWMFFPRSIKPLKHQTELLAKIFVFFFLFLQQRNYKALPNTVKYVCIFYSVLLGQGIYVYGLEHHHIQCWCQLPNESLNCYIKWFYHFTVKIKTGNFVSPWLDEDRIQPLYY